MSGAQRVLGSGDDGSVIHVGSQYVNVESTTLLRNQKNNLPVFEARGDGAESVLISINDGKAQGIGVLGKSLEGTGVRGDSVYGPGNVGESGTSDGVQGYAHAPNVSGVYGDVTDANGYGVFGRNSGGSTGYFAHASVGAAGQSDSRTGVMGYTGGTAPTPVPALTGVFGVSMQAGGRGGQFAGSAAPIRLVPSSTTSHPASGARGDLYVDNAGRLWFCQVGGNPATWRLVSLI
jgi:hypothetical protein